MAVITTPSSVSSLPNGTLINGVANFYTSTKPTVRVDGSVLVIGDVWYNLSSGVTGYWNGTYWLTAPVWSGTDLGFAVMSTNNLFSLRNLPHPPVAAAISYLFLHGYWARFGANQPTPANDYSIFRYFFDDLGNSSSGETGTGNTLASTQGQSLSNAAVTLSGNPNLAIVNTIANQSIGFQVKTLANGQLGYYRAIKLRTSYIL